MAAAYTRTQNFTLLLLRSGFFLGILTIITCLLLARLHVSATAVLITLLAGLGLLALSLVSLLVFAMRFPGRRAAGHMQTSKRQNVADVVETLLDLLWFLP